jgi:hypothetical protein
MARRRAQRDASSADRRPSPPPPVPVVEPGPDGQADPGQRQGDEGPAQGVEIGDQRLDRRLRIAERVLGDLDARRADGGSPAAPLPFMVRLSARCSRAGG